MSVKFAISDSPLIACLSLNSILNDTLIIIFSVPSFAYIIKSYRLLNRCIICITR